MRTLRDELLRWKSLTNEQKAEECRKTAEEYPDENPQKERIKEQADGYTTNLQ